MRNRLSVGMTLLAVASLMGMVSWNWSSNDRGSLIMRERWADLPARDVGPIDALDESIQSRFHNLDLDRFGIARMPVVPQHVHEFLPETAAEKTAVARLKMSGLEVVMILGGRRLLGPEMTEVEWKTAGRYNVRRAISDPIFVTSPAITRELPRPWDLREHARKAMTAFASFDSDSDSYTAFSDRWSIDARPVRADRRACLNCHDAKGAAMLPASNQDDHDALRLGDALGVVVYLYARN